MTAHVQSKFLVSALWIVGAAILLIGLSMLVGGIILITLEGSWFFALAGLGLSVSAIFLIMRRPLGAAIYVAVFGITILWSLWEVGLAFWPLFSRLFLIAVWLCCTKI